MSYINTYVDHGPWGYKESDMTKHSTAPHRIYMGSRKMVLMNYLPGSSGEADTENRHRGE